MRNKKENSMEITISLRENIQDGAIISHTYLSNRYEIVPINRDNINESLYTLLKETQGYMDRNKIGE